MTASAIAASEFQIVFHAGIAKYYHTYGADEGRNGNPPLARGSRRGFQPRVRGARVGSRQHHEAAKLLAREFGDSAAKQGFKPGMPEILAKMADSDIIYDFRSRMAARQPSVVCLRPLHFLRKSSIRNPRISEWVRKSTLCAARPVQGIPAR